VPDGLAIVETRAPLTADVSDSEVLMPTHRSTVLPGLAALACALAVACVHKSDAMRQSSEPSAAPPPTATQPSPFAFEIEELTLKFGERVIVHDRFQRPGVLEPLEIEGRRLTASAGPRYAVELGTLPPGNVRDGALRVDEKSTTNVWLGPKGTFGHRLHHHDVFITLVTIPISTAGESTFLAGDALPLEFSVRLRKPRFAGFEKLKIGLLDIEAFKNVAAVGIGRLPMARADGGQYDVAHGAPTQSAAAARLNILDIVARPAVTLNRVEEPDVLGEIVLAHADLPSTEADSVEMSLRADAEGRLTAFARFAEDGHSKEMRFEPTTRLPGRQLSRLSRNTKLSATLYVETLPRPAVFKVEPNRLSSGERRSAGTVRFRIEGMGFGADTRVEIVPENAAGGALVADGLELQRKAGGPEGTVLFADVALRTAHPDTYSLRLTSGGQTTVVHKAVQLF
jgi:hypothetical protein